ncbi:oxygenase MpaB family protein [Streptomyces sp. NPDC091292]|uniref:oxygenase MpaB family protein n=1 Tax=Streptomyces sp. NPDC091292 TaxID=3365991 RepID=UPI0037F39CD2
MHPARRPDPAHEPYRHLALNDCPHDLKMGLNLGFYRVFGIPAIARVLVGTGKLIDRPLVRAKATGALMYALVEHGLDSPDGRRAVTALNHLHARLPVGNAEFVYVLSAFCVTPMRWTDRHGTRRTTAREKISAHAFYADLADRMDIASVPGSYARLAHWMDDYEHRHMAPSPEGRALLEATRSVLAARFPSWSAPAVRAASATLFDAPLRTALGIPTPPAPVRWTTDAALRLMAARRRSAAT